ncbi:hypothetical protein L1987_84744 [Smallanthus sonchifolius]|uniref:Uncharacterized protein n=1 Tax=Smallanthus sonchifolius TaxID=185202 RepID=A0ACB8XU03_9ASTR|nr:hypothetical protein L1987_84744 [Smallanthus sonchifolius]
MVGAQALVAVPNSNGSIRAYTSSVTGFSTTLQPSTLSFAVPNITAERVSGDVVIYATLVLPTGGTRFNQVWQVGPTNNGAPVSHAFNSENRNSLGSVDFSTGEAGAGGSVGGSRNRRRNVFALLLRPKPDHKYRLYWNIYHHSLGYSIIINVYEGLDILDPEKKWKNAYSGILISLGVITIIMEALTWFDISFQKKKQSTKLSYLYNTHNLSPFHPHSSKPISTSKQVSNLFFIFSGV